MIGTLFPQGRERISFATVRPSFLGIVISSISRSGLSRSAQTTASSSARTSMTSNPARTRNFRQIATKNSSSSAKSILCFMREVYPVPCIYKNFRCVYVEVPSVVPRELLQKLCMNAFLTHRRIRWRSAPRLFAACAEGCAHDLIWHNRAFLYKLDDPFRFTPLEISLLDEIGYDDYRNIRKGRNRAQARENIKAVDVGERDIEQ